MRISEKQRHFIKKNINTVLLGADIFLFGSRVNDQFRGGDIDILVIGEKRLSFQQIRDFKIAFYKQFGEQKIDIVTFKNNDSSTFQELVLLDAERL